MSSLPTIEEITETFKLLDDWEERYRYIIDLGRKLSGLPEEAKVEANRVQGCTSQVWLTCDVSTQEPACLNLQADSDAHIVRGLIAIVLTIYGGKPVDEIVALNPKPVFEQLGLQSHLTPTRANGLASMVQRIQVLAKAVQQSSN